MKTFKIFILLLFFLNFSCESLREAGKVLRNEKVNTTDEFLVKQKEPLELPPDYNLIEPGSFKKKKKKETLTQILNKSLTPDKVLDVQNSGPVSNTTKSLEEDLLKKIK